MSVVAVIKMPMDGADGNSGTNDPAHIAGYTVEQFSARFSTFGGSATRVVHATWSCTCGFSDTGLQIKHRHELADSWTMHVDVLADDGSTDGEDQNVTSITFAPTWQRFVKNAADGGSDAATGVDDAHALATIDEAMDRWTLSGNGKGVPGAIWVKRGSNTPKTGTTSPDHGFLVIAPYGSGAKPIVSMADGSNIQCLPDQHVPMEWGWSVYARDIQFIWAGRDNENAINFNNAGSQFDGCTLYGGGTALQATFKKCFINGVIQNTPGSGMFVRTNWAVVEDNQIDHNGLGGINSEHQIYGDDSFHWTYRRNVLAGNAGEANDGFRFVHSHEGYIADNIATALPHGDAYYAGANGTESDDSNYNDCIRSVTERCIADQAERAYDTNWTTDAVCRNNIFKRTTGNEVIAVRNYGATHIVDNLRVLGNVHYDNPVAEMSIGQYGTDLKVRGVIWMKTGGTSVFFDVDGGFNQAELSSDYNCFWRVGGTPDVDANFARVGGVVITFAAWKALGFDTHSKFKDPLFVNPSGGDFHLQSGSPCIGTGFKDFELPFDYDGITRADPPSMGAFEFIAGIVMLNRSFFQKEHDKVSGSTAGAHQYQISSLLISGFVVKVEFESSAAVQPSCVIELLWFADDGTTKAAEVRTCKNMSLQSDTLETSFNHGTELIFNSPGDKLARVDVKSISGSGRVSVWVASL